MRFSLVALATPLLLAASVIAGHNCKCQDSNGQYNPSTLYCCGHVPNALGNVYHENQVHQCSSAGGGLDSGAFVICCQFQGHGGAFCWD